MRTPGAVLLCLPLLALLHLAAAVRLAPLGRPPLQDAAARDAASAFLAVAKAVGDEERVVMANGGHAVGKDSAITGTAAGGAVADEESQGMAAGGVADAVVNATANGGQVQNGRRHEGGFNGGQVQNGRRHEGGFNGGQVQNQRRNDGNFNGGQVQNQRRNDGNFNGGQVQNQRRNDGNFNGGQVQNQRRNDGNFNGGQVQNQRRNDGNFNGGQVQNQRRNDGNFNGGQVQNQRRNDGDFNGGQVQNQRRNDGDFNGGQVQNQRRNDGNFNGGDETQGQGDIEGTAIGYVDHSARPGNAGQDSSVFMVESNLLKQTHDMLQAVEGKIDKLAFSLERTEAQVAQLSSKVLGDQVSETTQSTVEKEKDSKRAVGAKEDQEEVNGWKPPAKME